MFCILFLFCIFSGTQAVATVIDRRIYLGFSNTDPDTVSLANQVRHADKEFPIQSLQEIAAEGNLIYY